MSRDLEPAPDGGGEQFDWVIADRLAFGGPVDIGTTAGQTLPGRVRDAARACYAVRGLGHHLEPDGVPWARADAWLRVAFGLAGSIAESLSVCAGFDVETQLLRSAPDPRTEIAVRAFSIASSQELIGVGHRLVNLAQRALGARDDYRDRMLNSPDGQLARCAAEEPRSRARAAWLSLNQPTIDAIVNAVGRVSHPSICGVLDELQSVVRSDEWTDLVEIRGEVFHRSRPESSVASGVDATSGYSRLIRDYEGRPVGSAVGGRQRYGGGDGRMDLEASVVRAALDRLSSSAVIVTTNVAAAVEPLTSGLHQSTMGNGEVDEFRTHYFASWTESECGCQNERGSSRHRVQT